MKQIIVVKPNTLSAQNKKELIDSNFVVIEHENPSEVRIITQLDGFDGDDMFSALIGTIKKQGFGVKSDFAELFLSKVQDRVLKKSLTK